MNQIFHFTNEIKRVAFLKGLKIFLSLSILMLTFWFCSSFSSGEDKRQECAQALLCYPDMSPGISLVWIMKTLSLFHCFSVHFLVPYWGDPCSAVVYTCLSKLFLLLCFYYFWNMKLTAIILPVFTRKAFSKRELLIIKCFNSEKEAKIHAQETVDKNAHIKTTKWVPAAVADWVSFWERSRFQPKCTCPFQWFLHKKLLWYSLSNHLRLKFLFLF